MWATKLRSLGFSAVSLALVVGGCTANVQNNAPDSGFTPPHDAGNGLLDSKRPSPGIPRDSGSPSDSGGPIRVDSGMVEDGGTSGGGCNPAATFHPVTWAPPTSWAVSCTQQQLTDYYNCTFMTGDCSSFRTASANATCVYCLETDVGATLHGPVVTSKNGTTVTQIEANYGGCMAYLDTNTTATGCGAEFNAFNDCVNNDCGSCSDATNPTPGGPFDSCEQTALGSGSCMAYPEPAPSCINELNADGGTAAQCNTFQQMIFDWCGGL